MIYSGPSLISKTYTSSPYTIKELHFLLPLLTPHPFSWAHLMLLMAMSLHPDTFKWPSEGSMELWWHLRAIRGCLINLRDRALCWLPQQPRMGVFAYIPLGNHHVSPKVYLALRQLNEVCYRKNGVRNTLSLLLTQGGRIRSCVMSQSGLEWWAFVAFGSSILWKQVCSFHLSEIKVYIAPRNPGFLPFDCLIYSDNKYINICQFISIQNYIWKADIC